MQFFAWNEKQHPISAPHALKHKDYVCPECARPVRLRSGPHRQPHFFHLESHSDCRQHQKSAEHLQTQFHLMSLLPEGECCMERPFPSLGRIADLTWESERIVFEVQCSPLPLQEAKERCVDYRSAGFEIVWILHQKTFNRRRMSAAESWLRQNPCYFTDISKEGKGKIYDQYDIDEGASRLFKGPPLEVSLAHPVHKSPLIASPLPRLLQHRFSSWPLSFQGDFLDRWLKDPHPKESALHLLQLEERYLHPKKVKRALFPSFRNVYTRLLTALLKKLGA
jgi:competence protein CoiA